MIKYKCPSCKNSFWQPMQKTEKEYSSYKWYQFAKMKFYCPHCHVKLRETEKSKKLYKVWLIIFIPFMVLSLVTGWPEVLEPLKWPFMFLVFVFIIYWHKNTKYLIDENNNDK